MNPQENTDITYFARTNFRGTDQVFGIKRKDRRQHMYVLGKSGTGKSVMLENMIIQNIKNGEGVCVVDPHGELAEKILESIPAERAQDVVYFNPADTDNPIGFNVLQLDDPKYKHLVASGLMGIFTKIWANAWSSRMEYILSNAVLALLDSPDTTLLGIPRLLVDKDYRQYIINNLKDPVVKAFWVHEYEAWRDQFRNEAIAPIQNKVGQFLSSAIVRNVVGQSKSTVDIFNIMNEKKIFIVNVSKGRIGEDNSALLGGMIITKIQLAAMERVRIPEQERKDFYLYIDEFQNFSTESFGSILSEARKYRLCLTVAHQYTAQLDETVRDAVFGNVGTMIIFRVGADDAANVEKEFLPEFDVEDFVNLPNYHIYTKLMVDGVTSRPFSARTLPPIEIDTTPEVRQQVIDTSRKLYTKPRDIVETEVERWSSTVPGQKGLDEGDVSSGKFKAECSNDKKVIYVPFEPEPGKPIYCKECLFKIKTGELQPLPGYRAPKEKKDNISYDSLASLGIEFQVASPRQATEFPIPTRNYDSRPVGLSQKNNTSQSLRPVNHPVARPQTKPLGDKIQKAFIEGKDTTNLKNAVSLRKEYQRDTKREQTKFQPKLPSKKSHETIVSRTVPRAAHASFSTQQPKIERSVDQKNTTENIGPNQREGLREILSQVITATSHDIVKETSSSTRPIENDILQRNTKKMTPVVKVPEKTISLAELKSQNQNIQKDKSTTHITSQNIAQKSVTEASKSALVNALEGRSSLIEHEVIPVEKNIASSSIGESRIPEKLDFQTHIAEIPHSQEILQPIILEDQINDTPINSVSETTDQGSSSTSSHQGKKSVREAPEDLLRSILE